MKIPKICVCVLLAAALLLPLTGCRMLNSIRELALKNANLVILDTPEELSPAGLYLTALDNALAAADSIEEQVSFSVSSPRVIADENAPALLGEAAKQLADLIMGQDPAPGSAKRTLTAADAADTLLRLPADLEPPTVLTERNTVSTPATDDRGNALQDENGNAINETKVSDNLLKLTYGFYTDEPTGETDENGDPVTKRVGADPKLIERVFGPERDRGAVLARLEPLKDYLQIRGYTVDYTETDSAVKCEIDLAENRLNDAAFHRGMTVTAEVTGVGALAAYGDFTVEFRLSEDTVYTAYYPAAEG